MCLCSTEHHHGLHSNNNSTLWLRQMWETKSNQTVLILGLQNQTFIVLEALGGEVSYHCHIEALESHYGESHLKHIYWAQPKYRSQRYNESLEQWLWKFKNWYGKLTKWLQHSLLIDCWYNLLLMESEIWKSRQLFSLGNYTSLKGAVAHAEEEAVYKDPCHTRYRIQDLFIVVSLPEVLSVWRMMIPSALLPKEKQSKPGTLSSTNSAVCNP